MAKDMRRCCEIVLITEKMQMSVYTGVGEIDSGDGCANGLVWFVSLIVSRGSIVHAPSAFTHCPLTEQNVPPLLYVTQSVYLSTNPPKPFSLASVN